MHIVDRNVTLKMVRGSLVDIPVYPVPAGYSIGPYFQGDEHRWGTIQTSAGCHLTITPELYRRE